MTTLTIAQLKRCLRGEISAAETYKMAMDKLRRDDHGAEVERLRALQRRHGVAAQQIRERIVALGGEADDNSGAWGSFARGVQGVADLFGDTAALKSLKEGEEHGLHVYAEILADTTALDPASRSLIDRLHEQQRRCVEEVDALMASV